MKVSIITIVYNSVSTIEKAIKSVAQQNYSNIEYIMVDGGSDDGTVSIIQKSEKHITKWVSEADEGLYDALNKGLKMATGDIIGLLHADDMLNNNGVVSKIVRAFESNSIEAVFGDIVFVSSENPHKILRYYSAKNWHPGKFVWGYMPPHPSFFAKKSIYQKYGVFKTDYKIAADYELLIRFLKVHQIKYKYLPMVTTKMRLGGASTKSLSSTIILNKEIIRACRENGLHTNLFKVYSKYFFKVFELVKKG